MSSVVTIRFNEELEIKLKHLVEYYSNPIVSSKNSDVIKYALEKLYNECYEEEQFRNKFNLLPNLEVICPNCEKKTVHKIDDFVDAIELIEKGQKKNVGYECQACGDCLTYDELINGDGRLIPPANQRKEINHESE